MTEIEIDLRIVDLSVLYLNAGELESHVNTYVKCCEIPEATRNYE